MIFSVTGLVREVLVMNNEKQRKLLYIVCISLIIISFSAHVSADKVYTDLEVNKQVDLNVQPFNTIDINAVVSESGIDLDELYLSGDFFGGQLTLGRKYIYSRENYVFLDYLVVQGFQPHKKTFRLDKHPPGTLREVSSG